MQKLHSPVFIKKLPLPQERDSSPAMAPVCGVLQCNLILQLNCREKTWQKLWWRRHFWVRIKETTPSKKWSTAHCWSWRIRCRNWVIPGSFNLPKEMRKGQRTGLKATQGKQYFSVFPHSSTAVWSPFPTQSINSYLAVVVLRLHWNAKCVFQRGLCNTIYIICTDRKRRGNRMWRIKFNMHRLKR